MAKATMQDVATESGVSVSTVSRAYRDPNLVSPKSRQRIDAAIKKLNYKYKMLTNVAGCNYPVIALLIPSTICFGFTETLLGIHEASEERGFSLTLGCTNYDSQTEHSYLEKFRKSNIAGLILAGFSLSNKQLIREIARSGVPTCVICEIAADTEISYVGFDNFRVVYDLTEHLISSGHRHIGLLCGPYSKSERPYQRLNGYRAALEENNITYDASLVYEDNPSMENGKVGMKQIMSLPEPPSAIVAAADAFAFGAYAAAQEMGINIPEDVSIVGVDDLPYSAFTNPPLTTSHAPGYDMGYKSVEVITQNIYSKKPVIEHKCFDVSIVLRESTKKVKTKN